jgi:EAL domain-containing protein (putative c-di-GMP-specific phosphodiesterase class I)
MYQPIVALDDERVAGLEALVRWEHPTRGLISPGQFIPLAEATGLIAPLGRWVLRTACRQAARWQHADREPDGASGTGAPYVSVNLSGRQLEDAALVEDVAASIVEAGLEPARLLLEITESVLMQRADAALRTLHALKALGVRLAIDDFGTGYSSLSYLKQLPAHEIKIDKSFVLGLGAEAHEADASIVRSVTTLVQALEREVVAEGVESKEAWDLLRSMGCDVAQGYFLSRPLPAAELERWVRTSPWGRERASA